MAQELQGPVQPPRKAWAVVSLAAVLVAGGLALGNWLGAQRAPAGLAVAQVQGGGPVAGKADAPLTVEIYEDFQCPFCALANREIVPQLLEQYVAAGKVRLVIHDLAIIGPESLVAARGASCAAQQSMYWPFHDRLYREQHGENTGWLTAERMSTYAADLGLKADPFQACMADPATEQAVRQGTTEARQAGVQGTPWWVVGGKMVGEVRNFAYLDRLLQNLQAVQK